MKKLFFILLPLALWSQGVFADGTVARGQTLSAACVACHNADGNSTNPAWPKLADQHAGYLVKQLKAFRQGAGGPRHNGVMFAIVAKMSDSEFEDLAAYFAAQVPSENAGDASQVALGEQLYKGGNLATGVAACTACHGPAGQGEALAGYPKVAGQMAPYMKVQLEAFRSGERKGQMMHDTVMRMTDAEIVAVSEYMAGLRPAQ